jgi:hypothetical protein
VSGVRPRFSAARRVGFLDVPCAWWRGGVRRCVQRVNERARCCAGLAVYLDSPSRHSGGSRGAQPLLLPAEPADVVADSQPDTSSHDKILGIVRTSSQKLDVFPLNLLAQ